MEAARPATPEDVPRSPSSLAWPSRSCARNAAVRCGRAVTLGAEPLDASLTAALADDVHLVLAGTVDDAVIGYARGPSRASP